jgi:queuine tRNA-ribosyltransferase
MSMTPITDKNSFQFDLLKTDGNARRGRLQTPHGTIETPIFMPVGTQGSVKSLAPDDLTSVGTQILLGNTYHLMLRPGAELIARFGGLHKFMSWPGPILTDSGGFQIFSLGQGKARGSHKGGSGGAAPAAGGSLVDIDEDGVTFRSYIDGSKHRMTPEDSMRIQMALGSDFIMAFDQCPPGQGSREEVRRAMTRTSAWIKRCKVAMQAPGSRLLGIVQGGIYEDLRREHAEEITQHDLFGYAIGGLSVGEPKPDMWRALAATTPNLPSHKPRYLMGVGTPEDLLEGVKLGVDMFDCVMPTRNARNATLFTSQGKLHIKGAQYKEDKGPADPSCRCYTCTNFSRGYLRHLYASQELLFFRLASLHNVAFYLDLMSKARAAIEQGSFDTFYKTQMEALAI